MSSLIFSISGRRADPSLAPVVRLDRAFGRRDSRRADLAQEDVDLGLQRFAVAGQFGRGIHHPRRRDPGLARGVVDAGDVFGDGAGSVGGFGDVARNFQRRRTLLLDGGGGRAGDFVDPADGRGNALGRVDARLGRALDGADVRGNFIGGLGGLARQRLDLGRDHGKAAAGFARTRGL
jgi:hypothetical protein